MPLLHWFWRLKLRWRIPLGLAALLVAAASLTLLIAWTRYRRCRNLDLLSLVPERLAVVARCRDGAKHWDRIRESDLYKVVDAQIRRHGPLIEWIEALTGRTWNDLTAPLTSGPASAVLTEARLRGLFGADVIAAAEPPSPGSRGPAPMAPPPLPGASAPASDRSLPRAVLLTRIGFLEYLAYPLARRLAEGRLSEPPACERYRGLDVYRLTLPGETGGAAPGGRVLAFAVKGDILAVATDGDLLQEVLDRTFRGWTPTDDFPAWSLPESVPFAAGADLHRLPAPPPPARGWRDALRTFPVREGLLPLNPDDLGRCTFALDVRAGQVRLEASIGTRPGASPLTPIALPSGGASTTLAGIPDNAVAFAVHRVPFLDFWSFFERTSLDPSREVAAADVIGNAWKFFQNQARDVEIPALKLNKLMENMMPHLRGGATFVLMQEEAAGAPKGGDLPPQTVVALIETSGTGKGAETALHDLLQRRIEPLLAKTPGDVTETILPAGRDSIRFLVRKSWPVQAAYGETRGVLALGVRPEAVIRVHETLQGQQRGITRSARFKAVEQALGRGEGAEASAGAPGRAKAEAGPEGGAIPPDVLTLLYADFRRMGALVREVAPDLARFAKDQIDGPRLRQTLKGKAPRSPQETPEAYEQRISALFEKEVRRVVDDARRRLELPLGLLELFTAGGIEVTSAKDGYRVKGILLLQ